MTGLASGSLVALDAERCKLTASCASSGSPITDLKFTFKLIMMRPFECLSLELQRKPRKPSVMILRSLVYSTFPALGVSQR